MEFSFRMRGAARFSGRIRTFVKARTDSLTPREALLSDSSDSANSDQRPADIETGRLLELFLLGIIVTLFAGHAGFHGYHAVMQVGPDDRIPWNVLIPLFATFGFVGALLALGWRRTLALFGLACGISFAAEWIGESTGLIFGNYYYTDVLRPKILGRIPVIIPLAYFMLLYPAYLISNLLLDGKAVAPKRTGRHLVGAALLTALIMTAWDLAYDPLMTVAFEAWVWPDGGAYFGVPFHNFFGWVGTCFVITLAFGLVEPLIPLKPLGKPRKWVSVLALVGFMTLGIGDIFSGFPEGTRVLAPFTMGIPILAALLRLYVPES